MDEFVPQVGDINECRFCADRIYGSKWGQWLHYGSGLMLCVPDEDDPDFTGVQVATPRYTEEELVELREQERAYWG